MTVRDDAAAIANRLAGLDIMVNNPVMVVGGPFEKQTKANIDGAILEAITAQVQLGRASLPEEGANMVAFPASEAADHLCGQTTDVAGGQWLG